MIKINTPAKLIASMSVMFGMAATSFANSEQYPGTQQGTYVPEGEAASINGQYVKVGEKNQYLYAYPKFNISLNPFAPLLEYFSASASYAVSGNVALRGDFSIGLGTDNGGGFTLSDNVTIAAPIYFKKVYSGFFLEPGMRFGKLYDEMSVGYQVSVGWHWIWDSGLNASVGFGLGRTLDSGNCDDSYYCDNDDVYGSSHIRVGYAF